MEETVDASRTPEACRQIAGSCAPRALPPVHDGQHERTPAGVPGVSRRDLPHPCRGATAVIVRIRRRCRRLFANDASGVMTPPAAHHSAESASVHGDAVAEYAVSGFLDRTTRAGATTYRYVVYVPFAWTADREWPVTLFLH